jgi:CRISPR-associated DxTHG motif protein
MTAEPGEQSSPVGSHYLLTVLGRAPRPANYALHGGTVQALMAPLALLDLLPPEQRPSTVVALCTDEAKAESLPLLQDKLPKSCRVIPVEVPSGHSQADINSFLTKATAAIPPDEAGPVRISLDVTHGFRHFSFLTYIAGLYLVGLRDIELAGAWYGLLQEGESPFLDLRPLLELPRWIHALQVLRDTGSALPLAESLQAGLNDKTATTIARELRQISECYLSALPLELGCQVGQFRSQRLKAMTSLVRNQHQLPLAKELVTGLDQLLLRFALDSSLKREGWKKTVPLTRDELQRQAILIDGLFLHQDEAMALGLLDEWTVSWALWCLDDTQHWLNFGSKRRRAGSQLGALAAACQKPALKALLTPEQKALGDFWHLLSNLRNGFHHHGMREEEIVGNPKTAVELSRVKTYWHDTLRACPRFSLRVGDGDGGALLVSPIGYRPGVLFSALLACRERIGADPAACLVICSSESADAISEAASQAGFSGPLSQLVLEDPFGGHQEFARLRREAQGAFLQAGEVLVNVTGGTTLMGMAAQELASLARTFARPIQRFGLIDRRPSDEQVADPYRAGEAFWLQEVEEER